MEELLLLFNESCALAHKKLSDVAEQIQNGIVPSVEDMKTVNDAVNSVRDCHDAVREQYVSETGRELSSDVPVADIIMLHEEYLAECHRKYVEKLCGIITQFLSVRSDSTVYMDALLPSRKEAKEKLMILKADSGTVSVDTEELLLSALDMNKYELLEDSFVAKLEDAGYSDLVQAGLFKGRYYLGDEIIEIADECEAPAVQETVEEVPAFVEEPVVAENNCENPVQEESHESLTEVVFDAEPCNCEVACECAEENVLQEESEQVQEECCKQEELEATPETESVTEAEDNDSQTSSFNEPEIVKSSLWYSSDSQDPGLPFEEEIEEVREEPIGESSDDGPCVHTVVFDAQPGSIDNEKTLSVTVPDGAFVEAPEAFVYCEGSDFVYWYKDDEAEPYSFSSPVTEDIVFHAKWV